MKLLENKTILIIGLGLIGGSVARGLSTVPGVRILAYGRDETALQSALIDGSIHACSTVLETIAPQADIVVLCTPTLTVRSMLEQLTRLVGPEVILTDVASVKGNIVNDAQRFFSSSLHRFVPGHPIAGSEQSGYTASRSDLFAGRKVILTPLPENSTLAVRTVMQMWQTLGADVHGMTPQRHDEVLAGTSHLPHLLAFTLVNTLVDSVSEQDRAQQVFDYAAGGFADFSRIASSDPHMWRDIFLANRDATVDVLDAYIASLGDMRQRLLQGDGDGLQNQFVRAKRVRDEFMRRFRPSGVTTEDAAAASFTMKSDGWVIRPGSSLVGSYRPPASLSVALAALDHSSGQPGITRIEGFPECVDALSALDAKRRSGIPIVGPEQGKVWIYGEDDGVASVQSLPADPFITGLLALGAAMLPGSIVNIDAVSTTLTAGSMMACLQQLGALTETVAASNSTVHLTCKSSVLSGAHLELMDAVMSDDELSVVLAAASVAQGESILVLDAERARRLLDNSKGLFDWAAEITLHNNTLVLRPRNLSGAELDLGNNVQFSLLAIVMAQKANSELVIGHPGDVAGCYPGLIQILVTLGFSIEIK